MFRRYATKLSPKINNSHSIYLFITPLVPYWLKSLLSYTTGEILKKNPLRISTLISKIPSLVWHNQHCPRRLAIPPKKPFKLSRSRLKSLWTKCKSSPSHIKDKIDISGILTELQPSSWIWPWSRIPWYPRICRRVTVRRVNDPVAGHDQFSWHQSSWRFQFFSWS